jgi:4-carboxymuconolactone decarboxylase
LNERERLLLEVVRALCRGHRLGDALFERARSELGHAKLVELVTLVGYYGMLSFVLNAFEVPGPEG